MLSESSSQDHVCARLSLAKKKSTVLNNFYKSYLELPAVEAFFQAPLVPEILSYLTKIILFCVARFPVSINVTFCFV